MQPETSAAGRTPRTVSIVLGIAGGALDLGVGLLILASSPMASTETGMGVTWGYVGAILLLLLGGVVLGSTLQMVGAGFVGDEVGLLLTFDDYYSELTFEFLVAAVAFLILVALMIRYRTQILEEVFHLSRGERLTHVGVFLIGFSALSFAFGIFELGTPLVVIGITLFTLGYSREHRLARRNVS